MIKNIYKHLSVFPLFYLCALPLIGCGKKSDELVSRNDGGVNSVLDSNVADAPEEPGLTQVGPTNSSDVNGSNPPERELSKGLKGDSTPEGKLGKDLKNLAITEGKLDKDLKDDSTPEGKFGKGLKNLAITGGKFEKDLKNLAITGGKFEKDLKDDSTTEAGLDKVLKDIANTEPELAKDLTNLANTEPALVKRLANLANTAPTLVKVLVNIVTIDSRLIEYFKTYIESEFTDDQFKEIEVLERLATADAKFITELIYLQAYYFDSDKAQIRLLFIYASLNKALQEASDKIIHGDVIIDPELVIKCHKLFELVGTICRTKVALSQALVTLATAKPELIKDLTKFITMLNKDLDKFIDTKGNCQLALIATNDNCELALKVLRNVVASTVRK